MPPTSSFGGTSHPGLLTVGSYARRPEGSRGSGLRPPFPGLQLQDANASLHLVYTEERFECWVLSHKDSPGESLKLQIYAGANLGFFLKEFEC